MNSNERKGANKRENKSNRFKKREKKDANEREGIEIELDSLVFLSNIRDTPQ